MHANINKKGKKLTTQLNKDHFFYFFHIYAIVLIDNY